LAGTACANACRRRRTPGPRRSRRRARMVAPIMSSAQVSEASTGSLEAGRAPADGCRAGRAHRLASCWSCRRRNRRLRAGAGPRRSGRRSGCGLARATRCRITSVSVVDCIIAPSCTACAAAPGRW
jgi:hypothetical protein